MTPTTTSAGQAALRATGASLSQIATAAGVGRTSAKRWLAGTKVPDLEHAQAIEQAFPTVAAELWRRSSALPLLATSTAGAPTTETTLAAPSPPTSLEPGPVDLRPTAEVASETARRRRAGGLSSGETIAAVSLELRALHARLEAALKALTPTECLAGHPDVVDLRTRLLELLQPLAPAAAAAVAEVFPEPAAAGPAHDLAEVHGALVALEADLTELSAAALEAGTLSQLEKYDIRRARCVRYRRQAETTTTTAELLAGRPWSALVSDVGSVLREHPEALEAAQRDLEGDDAMTSALRSELQAVRLISFPSPHYQHDPVAFAREILGFSPWPKQVEILEAVRDHQRVAIASGHRVGKSAALAALALWFYASFPRARVFLTAPTDRQLQEVDWRQIRMFVARAGRCVRCLQDDPDGPLPCLHSARIDGTLRELARSGLRSSDFRQIVGFTAKETENVAGLAGDNLLFLIDEASGVADAVYEALEGNRAGGARIVLLGNPTRNQGEHYAAFYSKAPFYKTLRISSVESPNVQAGRVVIPGLATAEWIDEKREEWGDDSPLFKVRVLGEHAIGEDGRLIPVALIEEAEQRWFGMPDEGPLYIGLDPAGPTGLGDDTAIAIRRGQKILDIFTRRGLDTEGHLVEVLGCITRYARDREFVVVVVDAEGMGSSVMARLRDHESTAPRNIKVVGLKSSALAGRQAGIYDRLRDELAGNFATWLRQGGAIPRNAKLEGELHALELRTVLTPRGERSKVTAKDYLRKVLKRSPDRADACMLACWDQAPVHAATAPAYHAPTARETLSRGGAMDPYSGAYAWERR
jgi:uncharacterized protein YoaH (UPF0181 family)